MQLFEEEEILWQDSSGRIVLTNFRFRLTAKGSVRRVQSVLLSQILFCSYVRIHYPILAIGAILFFPLAFFRGAPSFFPIACLSLAVVLAIAYAATMKLCLVIHTSAESMSMRVSYHSAEFAEELIDAIEQAIVVSANKEQMPQKIVWPGA